MRSRRLRARSAWAAATGSSLARSTRIPAEVCSIWLASSFCCLLMLWMVRSYILAVPKREIVMAKTPYVTYTSAAHSVQHAVKQALCNLNHFGRGLVGLLVLQQARSLFVQVDARNGGAVQLQVVRHGGRELFGQLGALRARAHHGHRG